MRVSTWTPSTESGALGAPMVIAIIQCGTRTRTVIRDKKRPGSRAKACGTASHKSTVYRGPSTRRLLEAGRHRPGK